MAPVPSSWGSVTEEETGLHFGYSERTDYSRIAAMYAGADSQINVKGNVNMTIKGSGLVAKGANSAIIVGGGTMKMYDEAGWLSKKYLKNFYIAAAADGGKVNVNMNEAGNASGTNKTEMLGDVLASGAGSTLNIGLNTKDSKLSGVVRSENGGTANMYLGSGTWENKVFGNLTGFGGSVVENLVGGADADHRGVILQKDNNKLTVNNYSGHAMVFYDHTGNGTESIHYAGGDTLIKNAAAGSSIILSTGNNDITMDDEAQVNKVLATLAGKLTYEGFANKNLDAKVQIASGLTASSAAAKVGDITFGSNGKGEFVTAPPKPVEKVYNKQLTGIYGEDKANYSDVLTENNGQYNFGEGAKVTIDAGDVLALDFDKNNGVNENIVLSAKNGSITLKSASQSNTATQIVAASITHTGNFTIDAADTNITASSNNKSYAATGFIVQGSDKNGKTNVNIKGNLNINASGASPDSFSNVAGLQVKGDAVLNVDGNVVMKDENGSWGIKDGDKSGYANSAGIKVGFDDTTLKGATLNVKGTTDIVVDGSGVVAEQLGTINLNGDVKIKTNKDSGKVAYGVAATYGGVANVNMNQDGNGAGTNTVNIDGNIGVIKGWNPNATVNIGLSNDQSTLHGVVVNTTTGKYLGQANMCMSNNALWTNESYGAVDRGFTGSNVGKFVGGSDASHAGFVLQKDSRPLTIGNYSGHTVLVYEHTGDGSEASHFAAGDTHIKNAAVGSGIVVSTDNNGIDTGNTELVNKVLNNLAGKLYYDAFATGEKNLNGVVQIASGLTGSSVSKVVGGDITFSEADGKGQYVTAPPKPVEHVFDKQIFEDIDESGPLDYWKTGNPYVGKGVKRTARVIGQDDWGFDIYEVQYNFVENSTINVDANRGDVIASGSASSQFAAIDQNNDGTVKVLMNDKKLTLNVNGVLSGYSRKSAGIKSTSGNLIIDKVSGLDINVTNATFGGYGIWVQGDSGYANGDAAVTINNGDTLDKAVKIHNNSSPLDAAIYAKNNSGKAALDIKGVVDIDVKGETDALYMNEGKMNIGGGSIVARGQGKAINAYHGTITVNAQYDQDGNIKAAEKALETDIYGNVKVYGNNKTAIGLNTAGSTFTGAIHTADNGRVDMILSDGALWTNKLTSTMNGFAGSTVNQLVGGATADKAGYILQSDSNRLNVNNYSGHTVIVYEHTGDGSDASHFAAGDTHIKKAAAGSSITMSTDNNGINTNDQELVNKVLNNLAGKLYYDAFVTGEKNLSGVVQIASGLTGSSISKVVSGDITFNDKTGQGQYGTTPVPPAPPEHQTEVNFSDAITGNIETDKVYVDSGILKENGEYVFEKDSNITLTDANAALNAKNDVVIKAEGSTVNYVTNAGENAAQAIKNAAGKNINITADKTVVKVESTSGRVDGIYMSKGDITVNGALDVTAVGNGAQGVYANSGNHTFNGDVKITVDGKGGGWSHYGASGLYATSTMGDSKGSTITVNGMVDISGNGNGIYANAGGSSVTVQGGKIVVDDKNNKGYGAIRAENGVVNMNAKLDESGNLVGGNGKLVDITGNIVAGTGAVNPADKNGTKTAINLALDTKESKLHGLIINEFPAEGKPAGSLTFTGETNLLLQNGATWINENLNAEQAAKGSDVTKFVGGSDLAHAGVIVQKDANKLSIGNYSGHSYLVYEHINDGTNASDFTAGDTHIKNAAAGSGVTMVTDNTGIDVNNFDQVSKVLNNLAGKLYYDAYVTGEKNLTGKVQIASGLTGSAISQDLASGDMGFNETTGQGNVVGETIKPQPKPEPPAHQTEVNFSETITGNIETDKVYVDSGILKENGEYVFEKDSNITMSGTDAALNAKQDVVIKAEGSTLNFVTNAGENAGQAIKNAAGKNINITADKTVVKVESTSGRVDGIYMSKGDITVNGALDVTAVGNGAQGVYANSGNHTFNGDVKITVDGKGGGWGHYGASGLYATSTMGDSKGSTITVNGMVDISGNGNGIYANAGGSSVTVQGGKIVVNDKDNKGYGAIRAENGIVNMNAKLDESGKLVGGNGKLVDITGNIVAGTGAVNPADKNGTKTAINLALDTEKSKLHGLIINEFPEEGKQAGSLTFTGETNLVLQNGATWINESIKAEQAAKTLAAEGAGAQGSYVTNFIGGKDMASAGVIVQKDTNELSIGNYSGHTYLVYEHTGDGTNATDFAAGDTHIKNAAVGSGVTMVTDNINGKIDVNNKDQVNKVLNNLAGKLYYDAYVTGEKNLTGKVQIASGLTGSAISQDLASGEMGFNETTGQGNVVGETIKPQPKPEPPIPGPGKPEGPQLPGNISNGDYETLMMYGARAAMVDSMVAWRDTTAESFVRADELHKGAEDGAWVRINRGKVDYSGAGTEINGNFYGVQTGFDKSMGDGWTAGLMFDYRDGDSDYKMGSEGEHKLYGMGIYGTKDLGSNDYIDVVAKFGKVENDFTARNETGKELSGEYSATAYSMSAQYGKRFEDSNGGYFEPQAQLTWSHVNSDTYDAHCGDQGMNIDQTAFDSFVGRLRRTSRSNYR